MSRLRGRPKGPSPTAIKRMYNCLNTGPKSLQEITTLTKMNKTYVSKTLKHLENKGMITRKKSGHKKLAEIVKGTPPEHGWEIPWIVDMMPEYEKKKFTDKIKQDIKDYSYRSIHENIEQRVNEQRKRTLDSALELEGNKELQRLAKENKVKITIGDLWKNPESPICYDCIKNKHKLVFSNYVEETGEYCCPKCGIVVRQDYDQTFMYNTRK
jgi:DNA-binding HxlR family transcriptional regulator